jgi:multidrug efflux system membrane fusion protein
VTIKSRVAGQIAQVHVRDGQEVQQGALLFVIDQRPFQAAVEQANATLAKDTALASNAASVAKRQNELFQQKLISPADYDQARYAAESQAALVRADQAALDNAQLQLSYCMIRAPIAGQAGQVLVNLGNDVKSDDTSLLVINQISPIYVSFALPQQDLGEIRRHTSQGQAPPVSVSSAASTQPIASGALTFINNQVDQSTATIGLLATFQNQDRHLWPGQFVNVTLTLTTEPNALVVPSQAVQVGQQGQFVFVVEKDMTAKSLPVTVVRQVGNDTVIQGDLTAGQQVITDGQLRVRPGAKVAIQASAATSQPSSPEAMGV